MKVPFPIRAVPALTFRAWLTPPPIGEKTRARDRDTLAGLQSFRVGEIACIELGSGPLVLALHGWGGRPAQMVAPALALAGVGYRVVIPELPGHAGGGPTDIKQAAAAVRKLVSELGMPDIVIAHSFASMVMRLAFEEEAPPTIALFAPALDVNDALSRFGDKLGLFSWSRRGLRRRLEAWDPAMWPKVSGILPEQFPDTELYVIHDPADDEAPFGRSAELAALRPGTMLKVVTDVGHTRILDDPEVLDWFARLAATR
ncbi:MAG TPA: alpha/beta fold hydrolase [Acidimicrobiia bacterium]|nr:alpha/beta fold hydrolase [Acidimicrobiia bacterium]